MKWFQNITGVLLILMGSVWFLQGVGILPGSLMSGQIQWAVYGSIAAVIGIGLIILANRPKKKAPPPA